MAVKAKVEVGDYATESEVIREGLRALLARDRAVESWLRSAVAAAYDEAKIAPERLVDSTELRHRLAVLHEHAMMDQSY